MSPNETNTKTLIISDHDRSRLAKLVAAAIRLIKSQGGRVVARRTWTNMEGLLRTDLTIAGMGAGNRWPRAIRQAIRTGIEESLPKVPVSFVNTAERDRAPRRLARRPTRKESPTHKIPDSDRTSRAKSKSRALRTLKRRSNPVTQPATYKKPQFRKDMLTLLGALMTIKKRAWVMHWNSKGPNAYGDHLLFERIYTQMDDNIDALGERIVAFIGPVPYDEVMNFSQRPGLVSDNSVYSLRALVDLMAQVQELSSKIRTSYQVNAGLDDYLMALNNSLDTFIYLLQQRLR